MAHKQRSKRILPGEKPVPEKLPPPSSPPPPPLGNEQQHETPQPSPPPSHSPKKPKKNNNEKEKNQNEVEEPRKVVPALRIIWKIEEETALLKCMAAFIASTGLDPYKQAEAFKSFAKESEYSLPEASTYQLKEKIRRMKKMFVQGSRGHKFIELAKKVWDPENKTKGKESRFDDPEHEHELNSNSNKSSKRVLFIEAKKGSSESGSSKRVRFAGEEEECEREDDLKGFVVGNWSEVFGDGVPVMSEERLTEAFRSIEGSKKAEWGKKLEELKMARLKLYVKRAELIRDQARLMWEASKS